MLRFSDEVLADAGEWEDETFEDIEENESLVDGTNEWIFPTEPKTWWDRQGIRVASEAGKWNKNFQNSFVTFLRKVTFPATPVKSHGLHT